MADQDPKTEDKKMIEMEEQLNMLNKDDAKPTIEVTSEENKDIAVVKPEPREGMEVKPKKIPIGGIQMPGFFTRSRSKEKCKDGDTEHDVEGAELLQPSEKKEETSFMAQASRIKLPNPFRKSKTEEDKNESGEKPQKKRLVCSLRIPMVSVAFKRKSNAENLENQATPALASSETLDDTDKSADKENGMKNVPLDDKDVEKQETLEKDNWREKLKAYRLIISAFLLFILITIIIIAITCSGGDVRYIMNNTGKYVQTITNCGKIEGIRDDGGIAFRGIPYARPPIGELRFKNAKMIDDLKYCWNLNETFLAHNTTDYCVQLYSNGTISGNEDCLTLDVVTPYVRYDNPLPVIVLIGSESLVGGSPGKMRPSARYARAKDVIYVRPNFRLGALGFLALEQLSKSTYPEISGNYGLSDIVAALKWIQLNIEHFGGNRSAVTLFGHQAGATLVTALTTMRGAEKLFARAWATSGGALYPEKSLQESETANKAYLTSIDCPDVACLRKLSADQITKGILDTWRKTQPDLPTVDEKPEARHEWLVLDGDILRDSAANRWRNTENPVRVKLVLGSTAHSDTSQKLFFKYINWTETEVISHIKQSKLNSQGLVDDVLGKYEPTYKGLVSIITDIRTVCPLLHISSQMKHSAFYVVTQTRGESDLADVETDVDAILGRYEPKTPEQRRYVSTMQQLFYHFVYHGEVQYKETHKIMIIGQDSLPGETYSHCKFWEEKHFVPNYAHLD